MVSGLIVKLVSQGYPSFTCMITADLGAGARDKSYLFNCTSQSDTELMI